MSEKKEEGQELVAWYHKAEAYYHNNRNLMIGALVAVLVVAALLFYGIKYWMPEREMKAQSAMFTAQIMFSKDSFNVALNGGTDYDGFLAVGKKFSFTKAANLSNYYAGICYLQMKDYDNAIKYLKKYNPKTADLESMTHAAIGDAYAEKGDLKEGISYYRKAAESTKNEFLAPTQFMKLGMALEYSNDYKAAEEVYTRIKKEYPMSNQGSSIEAYIARVQAKQ